MSENITEFYFTPQKFDEKIEFENNFQKIICN